MINNMSEFPRNVRVALNSLMGLKLCLTKTTGNLRAFHFGEIQRTDRVLMGEYALHLSCPWRIEKDDKIVTGSGDHYQRADDNEDPKWEVGMAWGTYPGQALRELFVGIDPMTEVCMNITDLLVVEDIATDAFGGALISLSGGYRLVVFPSSSRSEEWRLLPPGDAAHFVVEAGEAYGGTQSPGNNAGG